MQVASQVRTAEQSVLGLFSHSINNKISFFLLFFLLFLFCVFSVFLCFVFVFFLFLFFRKKGGGREEK